MFVWVARFLVMLSLRNFLKYCIGDNSSAAGNENSFPRKAMSRAGDLVFLQWYDGFLISFAVVHDLLAFQCYLHQLNIHPVRLFHLHHCPLIITKIKTKNHERMKPTGRLKNRSTKKPYSPHVSIKQLHFTCTNNTSTSLAFFRVKII